MNQIFLLDDETGNYIELDVDESVIEIIYQITEIENIENRKDSVTKTIQLKGTEKNNYAFGHLYNLNRQSSETISNKLFFNYNPLKKVDCLIYDDNLLILRGYMMVVGWKVDKNGLVTYEAQIQGSIVGLKTALDGKEMTHLDLSDMAHRYSSLAIVDSWGGYTGTTHSIGNSRTVWTNLSNNTTYPVPFELGKGYVYANIDYGDKFISDANNVDYEKIKLQNFRPQVYAKEYLKRVLNNVGYTFEIAGNPTTIEKFNRLIVPDNSPDLLIKQKGILSKYEVGTTQGFYVYYYNSIRNIFTYPTIYYPNERQYVLPIKFGTIRTLNYDLIKYSDPYPYQSVFNQKLNNQITGKENILFLVTRDFKSSVRCELAIQLNSVSPSHKEEHFFLQLCKRKGDLAASNDSEDYDDFEVLSEKIITVPYNDGLTQNITARLDVDDVEMFRSEEFLFRLKMSQTPDINLAIRSGYFQIGKDENAISYKVPRLGDTITPQPPLDLKQFDFFKSLLLAMNMYCYSEKDNPKHLILKTYDDYYAKCSPLLVKNTAIDISLRIALDKTLEAKSNINLPKKYTFKYSEDDDYLNQTYQNRNGESYGTITFNDSLGTASEKKIELIFAPTPPAMIENVDRVLNFFTAEQVSLLGKKKMKVKPRLLFYSGVYACTNYQIHDEIWNVQSNYWEASLTTNAKYYALASSYLFSPLQEIHNSPFDSNGKPSIPIPIDDLMFAKPRTYFFTPTTAYTNLQSNGFQNYYVNQISELTNGNIFTLKIQAHFDNYMIANLDLSVPIFLNIDGKGYSYFKIISLEYGGKDRLSKLTIQKIN